MMSNPSESVLKEVLLVAYLYSPVENAGTKRVVKFVKYLPEFGYRPLILTTKTRGVLPDDAENFIFRTDDILGPVKRAYRSWKLRNEPPGQHANANVLKPNSKLKRLQANLLIPDPEILWYLPATQKSRQIALSHSVSLIYSTSPPETNHLIALDLKRKTGLPWVADFRDGWMFEPLRSTRLTSSFRHKIEVFLERKVALAADRLVTVNHAIAGHFRETYGDSIDISVIPNGFDPDDFAPICRNRVEDGKFHIVHTGSLSLSRAGRTINGLLAAIEELHEANAPVIKHLKVDLIGNLSTEEIKTLNRLSASECIAVHGVVSYPEALQHQVNADVLLLVVDPNAKGTSTTKLFEYLAANRPILILSGPSEAANLVTETQSGRVVNPNDVAGIKETICTYYAQWQKGELSVPQIREQVYQYSRRQLTENLSHIFNELVKH